MPLVNSATGRIKSVLLLDDDGSKRSAEVTRSIAEGLGRDGYIYNLIVPNESNILDMSALRALPCNVKTYVWHNADKSFKKMDWAHANATDKIMPRINIETGKSTIFVDKVLYGYKDGLKEFFKVFDIRHLSAIESGDFKSFYMKGGDYIADNDFIIVGPQTYSGRRIDMDNPLYWDAFLKSFEYQWTDSERVLKLADLDIYKSVWNVRQILYHLDLYLTYGGIYNGEKLFFLGEIMESSFNRQPDQVEKYKIINNYLLGVKEQLKRFFGPQTIVERIPIVPLNGNPLDADAGVYSYNNCIVNLGCNTRHILMPTYEDEPNERENAINVYEKYFHKVARVEIPSQYVNSFKQSLHCIACVLERW